MPGSILKFRIDTTMQSTKLVNALKDLIEAQAARIKDLEDLQKAQQGGENAAP